MNEQELRSLRLSNQQLIEPEIKTPESLVEWFGAVQAQDYYGALWGLGLRLQNTTETTIEKALTEKKIVRSWPMRGTLHFTPAEDLRWMLTLLAERIEKKAASRYRELGLDNAVFDKARKVIEQVLQGNKQRSRPEIYKHFKENNIVPDEQRGIHILAKLARDCVICFGARDGKQQTFALFDEWIPKSKELSHGESVALLAKRYFQSHGPATLADFVWWSGLTVKEAQIGVDSLDSTFEKIESSNQHYWFKPSKQRTSLTSEIRLLPSYDEYTVAYKDRSAILDPLHARNNDTGNGIFHPPIVIAGQVVGLWKRVISSKGIRVNVIEFRLLTREEKNEIEKISSQYAAFIERPLIV